MNRIQADLILLVAAAIWGFAFVFQKSAMAEVGPLTFIAARCALAALALAPFAWREMQREPQVAAQTAGQTAALAADRQFHGVVLIGGLAFFLAAAFQQFGLVTATVTNSSFITALYVIFTPCIVWAWHYRPPAPVVWPAAAVSFLGTWLLGGGLLGTVSFGDVLIAVCAVFWALHVVITGVAAQHGRPLCFTFLQFVIVGMLGLIGALLTENPSLTGLLGAAPQIAYVGLLSSALTFTWLIQAMRHTPAGEAAIIVSTESLFGALAGAVLLGERLTPIAWIGAALIAMATIAVQLAPHRATKPPARS